ncbi:MAG: sugar phosphorylase, partial [Cytophagales bacterium]|nr:sugar phosphorylase [Cytophagales bacterium]
MPGCFSSLHVLPFFPYSSDDGFSVIDYRIVDPALGNWEDIRRLSREYRFMTDLVINHISRHSVWFADFVSGHPPGNDFFLEPGEEEDLSKVVRPRNSSLLAPIWTRRGIRHVWATFSKDQIDLNFRNPEVLLEMIAILLYYMEQGTSLLRLDAIAFLWKETGTTCIHLPQTHAVVKIIRLIMGCLRPDSILLTETNVPHEENLSYFGHGDEAQMVYQFPLPPLLLHALNRGTAKHLTKWAASLPKYPKGCTVLNFTASHDGIGLRALEGIIPQREVDDLVESMHRFGGFVSMRMMPDGSQKPYEINISLIDAMKGTRRGEDTWQVGRFLCSQAVMLVLKGIPAVYIHSMLGTINDLELVEQTGRTRSINRKKWTLDELMAFLENASTINSVVFNQMKHLLQVRRGEPCFHPDCSQIIPDLNQGLFTVIRTSSNSSRVVIALHNVTPGTLHISLQSLDMAQDRKDWLDILTGETHTGELDEIILDPYQMQWLVHDLQAETAGKGE